jgi:hypothetical protein
MNSRHSRLLLLALFGLGSFGCGRSGIATHPVHGRVMLGDRPVTDALVVFHPLQPGWQGEHKPLAYTDANGCFELMTSKPGDGAPEGEYTITVVRREVDAEGDERPNARNLLPARYADPKRSGFRFHVQPGHNVVPDLVIKVEVVRGQ